MNWVIGIIIDIILLLTVVLCARKGHKDGFAKTLVSFMGFFIALVVATTVCTPLATLTYNTVAAKPVETTVQNFLDEKVDQYGELDGSALLYAFEESYDEWPDLWKKSANGGPSETIRNILNKEGKEINTQNVAHQFSESIVKPVLVPTLSAVCFIVTFIIILIICKVLAKSLKLVNKIPLLGGVNAFLGGLLGVLKGIIFVLIINWALVMLVGENGSLLSIITPDAIRCSLINKYISVINPINMLFEIIKPMEA